MSKNMLKCEKCHNYTLSECVCGGKVLSPKPPKYSPEDKYASYRRRAKNESNS